MGSPSRYGSGARNEPQDVPGAGRREAPFGPEISWPYGFRPLDSQSREVLESAYGAGPLNPGYGSSPAYQPPAMDDYGDPGYSDPSYEGPAYGGSSSGGAFPAYPAGPGSGGFSGGDPLSRGSSSSFGSGGYGTRPGFGDDSRRASGDQLPDAGRSQSGYQAPSAGAGIWPVTGAQEALPGTSPGPSADTGRGFPRPGQPSYPDQWYDNPRLDDQAHQDPRPARSADPRLEGMTYGELRYDDTGSFAAARVDSEPDPSGERLDDESWYRELRRSDPAYPQNPSAPGGPGRGPQHRMEPPRPSGPAFGSSSGGYSPAPDRAPGSGQPRWSGPDRPQMKAGARPAERGPQAPAAQVTPLAQATGFLSAPAAPAASVGLLTAPSVAVTEETQVLSVPDEAPTRTPPVRPGHGLDGPSITSSWPTQPAADDLESYDDFWRDDADEEYTGLFGDREAEFQRAAAKQAAAAKRQIGRRRGRSNDHRLWLGLGGVVVVAAAAIAGIVKFEFAPSHSGPAHTMATPATIGSFTRTKDLEHAAGLAALQAKVINMSSGQATHVVSAVYESGNSAAGNSTQIVMFIGGHLAHADPGASVTSFTQQFKGAKVVSPGAGGGEAACVQDGTGSNAVAMCAWFDNDSFGEVVSPTMNGTQLARQMAAMRPSVEVRAAKS